VAVDPLHPDSVYAGLGSRGYPWSGGCTEGVGLLKSTDGGSTWSLLPATITNGGAGQTLSSAGIYALAFHPSQSGVMLAGATGCTGAASGIYRSTDGGSTWARALTAAVDSLVIDASGQYAYAGVEGGSVYRSSDGGQTWSNSSGSGATGLTPAGTAKGGSVYVAVSPSNPATVLASVAAASGGALQGLYLSQDRGQTWSRLANAPDYCGPQCFYYPAVAFHPANVSILFAGGLHFYRSSDAGATWAKISDPPDNIAPHVDHHGIAFSKDGSTLYLANDGGVWKSLNSTSAAPTWTALNNTLAITEFFSGFSVGPDLNYAIGGTQDNNTVQYSGTTGTWIGTTCGDGAGTAIDPVTPTTVYVACITGGPVAKSTSGGTYGTWNAAYFGIDTKDRFNWPPPLAIDSSNPSRLYFGTHRVYQTVNGANSWTAISGDVTGGTTGAISTLAVSADSNTVYSGSNDGHVWVTNNAAAAASAVWANRSTGLPNRYVSGITPDPTDPQTAYVALSGFSAGHIFKTTDQGKSWTNISGNLPDIPANDIAVDPDLPGTLYVATDIGIFRSIDQKVWAPLAAGLPHTVVTSVRLHRATRTLRAATYGRSVWDLAVPVSAPRLLSVTPAALKTNLATTVTVTGTNFSSNCTVQVNGAAVSASFPAAGTISVSLKASDVAAPQTLGVAVACANGVSNPLFIAVDGPQIDATGAGIISGASFQPGIVSGGWTTIRGTKLASTMRTWAAADFNGSNLPTSLDGVSVTINGRPAYVYYISPTQLNVLAPDDAATGQVSVVVTNALGVSNTVTAAKMALAPELFTASLQNVAYPAATDGAEYIGPAGLYGSSLATRPARPGEYITLYATGLGPTNPPYLSGSLVSGALTLAGKLQVSIGGAAAPVQFAGLIGAGLYQINVQVPDTLPLANAPVVLDVNGTKSAAKVSLAIGLPDLAITRFVVPTTGKAGQELTGMSVTVVNQGNAPAGPFRVGFYLSTTWDVTAAGLAQQIFTGWSCSSKNTLAAKATYTCSGNLGIPGDLPPGPWFLIAYADDLNEVIESSRSNNTRVNDNGATSVSQ
jgi:uncharacterized protein (TIGR03437 family)